MDEKTTSTDLCVYQKRGIQWCGTAISENDVGNCLALCKAIAKTTSGSEAELATHLKNDPTTNSLYLPLVVYEEKNKVVIETSEAIICGFFTPNLLYQMVASQHFAYKYGSIVNGLIHDNVCKQQLLRIHEMALNKKKKLIFTGHSIAGSLAHLSLMSVLYQNFPLDLKQFLTQFDQKMTEYYAPNSDVQKDPSIEFEAELKSWLEVHPFTGSLPDIQSIAFGPVHVASSSLHHLLEVCGYAPNMISVINEHDCIPGILNLTQTSALCTKSAGRLVTLTKSLKILGSLVFPTSAQRYTTNMYRRLIESNFATWTLQMLDISFRKIGDSKMMQKYDVYEAVGTYVHLKDCSTAYVCSSIPSRIQQLFILPEKTLVGKHVLQHQLEAYVVAVRKRISVKRITGEMNYYERLNLPRTATTRDVTLAYRSSALKWHPDKWSRRSPEERTEAENVFKLLAEAFEILSDPVSRRKYDEELHSGGSSFTQEFVRDGTMNGMTLDEAIDKFAQVVEQFSTTKSSFGQSISSSSSTAASQASRAARGRFQQGNHDNMFMQSKMRVTRDMGAGNTVAQEAKGTMEEAVLTAQENQASTATLYVDADELLPSDIAAPTKAASSSMGALSMVGGAVAVGAGVSLVIGAWSHYSASTCKRKQAGAVRTMPPGLLMYLLQENTSTKQGITAMKMIEEEAEEKETNNRHLIKRNISSGLTEEEEEDLHAFFDSIDTVEEAEILADFEEEFYDCLDIEEDETMLPVGTRVQTPFGAGTIQSYSSDSTSVQVCLDLMPAVFAYINLHSIKRVAQAALEVAKIDYENKKTVIVNRILEKHHISEARIKKKQVWDMLEAGKVGALDSGVKAAGGVVLAKSIGRFASAFSTSAAAPLAAASILVDIGKDYMKFQQELSSRNANAMPSEANERLLMQEFRQNIGHHVVSGSSAAAGAGIGAFTFSSALTYLTGAAVVGPVGVLAATGAAVVGGVMGYYSGSSIYSHATSTHFNNHLKAKEEIRRLEMGAKVLFSEFDPENSGKILRRDAIQILSRLQAATKDSGSSESFTEVLSALNDPNSSEMVTWKEFWEWVSSRAVERLNEIEAEWKNTHLSEKVDALDESDSMYPDVYRVLGFSEAKRQKCEREPSGLEIIPREEVAPEVPDKEETKTLSVVELAQLESLVNEGYLTEDDERELIRILEHGTPEQRQGVWKTVEILKASKQYEVPETFAVGFSDSEVSSPKADLPDEPAATPEQVIDAFCSLMSTKGLYRFLKHHNIDAVAHSRHDELHALALMHAEFIFSSPSVQSRPCSE